LWSAVFESKLPIKGNLHKQKTENRRLDVEDISVKTQLTIFVYVYMHQLLQQIKRYSKLEASSPFRHCPEHSVQARRGELTQN
jgi:hypothetical protein